MSRVFSFLALVVAGIIIADIVTNGSQFAQAMQGVTSVENPMIRGLLGKPS